MFTFPVALFASTSAFTPNGAITMPNTGSVWFDGSTTGYTMPDSARFDLPDADWFDVALIEVEAYGNTRYIASLGAQGGPNSVQLYMNNNVLTAQFRGTTGNTGIAIHNGTVPIGWSLVGIQRRAGAMEIFVCPLNGAAVVGQTGASTAWDTFQAINFATPHSFGVRSSAQTGTYWRNNIAWWAVGLGSLSTAEMAALAAGASLESLGKTIGVHLKFDTAAATIESSANALDIATRVGNPLSRGGPNFAGMGLRITGVDTPSWGRVHQRTAAGNKVVAFSGTYAGAPAGIEARLIGQNDAQIIGWAPCVATGVGTWATSLTVPQGLSYYTLEVRFTNNPAILARTFYPFGVGDIILGTGQSNYKNMSTGAAATSANNTTGAAEIAVDIHKVCYYNGGSGVIGFRNHLATDLGCGVGTFLASAQAGLTENIPLMVADASVSGSSLTATPNGWLDLTGTTWATFLSTLAAVGGDASAIIWHQGEADGSNAVALSTYQTGQETLAARMRSSVGRAAADLPFFTWVLGHAGTTQSGSEWRAIRTAHLNVLTTIPNARTVGAAFDLDLVDALHYVTTTRGYMDLGRRDAQAYLNYVNPAVYTTGMDGPFITGAAFAGNNITLTVNLNGNPAIVLPSASPANIDGLRVRDGSNVLQTVGSWAISGNTLVLTMASPPAAGWTVDYMPTELVRTNSGAAYNIADNDNMLYGSNPVVRSPRNVPFRPMTAAIALA